MSEVQKPVVEESVAPVAPVTEAPAPALESAVETKPVEVTEPVAEVPVATAPVTEEAAAPVKEEIKPIEEGVLGFKAPGLLK